MTDDKTHIATTFVGFLAIVPACIYAFFFLSPQQGFDFIVAWLFWGNVACLSALGLVSVVAAVFWLYKKLKKAN
jgi:hypothetical protein